MGNSNKRTIIIVAIIFLLSVILGGIYYFKKGNLTVGKDSKQTPKQESQQTAVPKNISESRGQEMSRKLAEQKNFTGFVKAMQRPADPTIAFYEIDANLIDRDKVKDLDYSTGTVTMPSIKKTFKISVNKNTKLNVPGLNNIRLGDLVSVTVSEDVYSNDHFDALALDVMSKVSEENKPAEIPYEEAKENMPLPEALPQ
jgi:hypothetical protein